MAQAEKEAGVARNRRPHTRWGIGSVAAVAAIAGLVGLGGPFPALASPSRAGRTPIAPKPDSGWTHSDGNSAGTRSTAATGITPQNVPGLHREWARQINAISTQLTMAHGRLITIVTSDHPVVTARRLSTGRVLWRTALPKGDLPDDPVDGGGRVYVDYTDGASMWVEALRASSGHLLWRRVFHDGEAAGMAVAPKQVNRLVITMNSRVVALSAATGGTAWSKNQGSGDPPRYGHSRFYVEPWSGKGRAYRAATGHVLMSFATALAGPLAVSGRDLVASEGVQDGLIDYPALRCSHRSCRGRWWVTTSKPAAQPAVAHGRVVTMTSGPPDHLLIYRKNDGHRVAVVRIPAGASAPTIAGHVIFITDYLHGEIDAYDLSHPRHRVWRHRVTTNRPDSAGLVAIDHNRIAAIVDDDLVVYRLR
jgi:outer membrane protein assembly factor BamB